MSQSDPVPIESRIRKSILLSRDYLHRYAGRHTTLTDSNVELHEIFSQCLILLVTKDRYCIVFIVWCSHLNIHHSTLVGISRSPRLYNFFKGAGQLTDANYPCDIDTTSIALSVLGAVDEETLHSILDEMLKYRDNHGILEV